MSLLLATGCAPYCNTRQLSAEHRMAPARLSNAVAPAGARSRSHEVLQMAATGLPVGDQRYKRYSLHHDRLTAISDTGYRFGPHRVLTLLTYLGERKAAGGHTIFPLFDPPGARPPGRRGGSSEGHAVLQAIRARLERLIRAFPTSNGRSGLTTAQDPEIGVLARKLCDATYEAAVARRAPPCLAVPPTPGSSALFFQRTAPRDGQPRLANNSINTATMYQEGIPEELKREYGSTKSIAEASASGIQAMIAHDPASYSEAVKIVGTPNAFPFVLSDDDFLSSEEDDSDEPVVKRARA